MSEFLPLTFMHPVWLVMLPLVLPLAWLYNRTRREDSMWNRYCDAHLLGVLSARHSGGEGKARRNWILPLLLSLALIAVAGPSLRSIPVPLLRPDTSTVIIVDLSRSMQAQDIAPSRYQRALYKARDLIESHEDGQIALVAFAGAAFVVSPLTDDDQTLLNFIDSLSPDLMPMQGSRLDQAISMARTILSASVSQRRKIIAITDGAGDADKARIAAQDAAGAGIGVSILALGTAEGGPLKNASGRLVRDKDGDLVIAKVNLDELESVADAGNGHFVRMSASKEDINRLLTGVAGPGPDSAESDPQRVLTLPVNDGFWLVWLILPLTLLLFRRNVLWVLLVLIVVPVQRPAHAMDWQALWQNPEQRAREEFDRGDYNRAAELSTDPLLKGTAWYRSGDFDQAALAFAGEDSALADYNRGNALARQQKFEQAIEAYDQALVKNPQLEDARYNKSVVEEFLKQQQQQNQQSGSGEQGNQPQESDSAGGQPHGSGQPPQASGQQPGNTGELPGQDTQEPSETVRPGQQQEEEQPGPPPENALARQDSIAGESTDPQAVERWLNRLPDDPSELLRRKFLRDYQRQRSQP